MQIDHTNHADAAPFTQTGGVAVRTGDRFAARPRQPWGRLLKAVLDLAGEEAELVRHIERDWTSATFAGSRHLVTLAFAGANAADAGENFIIALPEHEFAIPRYLIADAQIVAVEDTQLPKRKLLVEVGLLLLEQA